MSESSSQKRCPPPICQKKMSKLKDKRASSTTLDTGAQILRPRLLRPSDLLTKRAKAPGRKGSKRLNQFGKNVFSDALSKEVLEAKRQAKLAARKKLKKQAMKRHHIGMELISTEERYVKSLTGLVTHFVVPLRAKIGKEDEILSREEFTTIFANVDQLLPLNQKLLESLKEVGPDGDLAEVFLKFAPFLKMYTIYLDGAEKSIEALQSRLEKDGESNKAIAALDALGGLDTDGLDMMDSKSLKAYCSEANIKAGERLQSSLIQPVQRIPRYRMLFEVILKSTPSSDVKLCEKIRKALDLICATAAHVNDSVRKKQEALNMAAQVKRFGGGLPQVNWKRHQRKLIKESVVEEFASKSGMWSSKVSTSWKHYSLFSDGLAVCGVPSDVLELRYWFPLSTLSMGSVIGKKTVLRIHGVAMKGGESKEEETQTATSFRFALQSEAEMSAWKSAFRDAFRGRFSERLGYLERKRKIQQHKRNLSRKSFASSKSSIVSGSTVSTVGFSTAVTELASHFCLKQDSIAFIDDQIKNKSTHSMMLSSATSMMMSGRIVSMNSNLSVGSESSKTSNTTTIVGALAHSCTNIRARASRQYQTMDKSRGAYLMSPREWNVKDVIGAPVCAEGYLTKRAKNKKWQQRYFRVVAPVEMRTSDNEVVVVAAFLASAKSEGVESVPKYIFALDANSEIRKLNSDQCEGKSNVFEINFGTTGSQVLHRQPGSNDPTRIVLQAESSDIMRRWIDYLEDVKIAATRRAVENQLDKFLGHTFAPETFLQHSSASNKTKSEIIRMLSDVTSLEEDNKWSDAAALLFRACEYANESTDRIFGFRCLLWIGECLTEFLRVSMEQAAKKVCPKLQSTQQMSMDISGGSNRKSRSLSTTVFSTASGEQIPVVSTPNTKKIVSMIKSSLLGALLVLREIGEKGFVKHAPSKMLSSEDVLDGAPPSRNMPMTPETSSALPIKLRRRLSISAENVITDERMGRWVSAAITALAQLQSVIPDKQLLYLTLLSFAQDVSMGEYEEDASFLPEEHMSAGEYLPNYALEKVKRFMGLEGVELIELCGDLGDDDSFGPEAADL